MILSCGIIIARRDEGRWLFLLLRAYSYWDFPKGLPEEGETPFQAALREVREETGLVDLSFPWGRGYRETEPYNRGRKKARYYLAETGESRVSFSVNPEIGKAEHDEFRWLPEQELRELTPHRLLPIIDWAVATIEEN